MNDVALLGPWVRRFLLEHLVGERNLAHNTQASYRDALLLVLPYVAQQAGQPIDRLTIEQISAELIRKFLLQLEQERRCAISTRNQRLAAIHALARFIGERSPEHIAWCTEIRAIPFKKTSAPIMAYLDKPEMDALLEVPDRNTPQGMRDYSLLLFLYNSGARADEAAQLTIADLDLGKSPSAKLKGKGSKLRRCPLWTLTADKLADLIANRLPTERVFLNRRKQPMTRFGVNTLVKRSAKAATHKVPSLAAKRVSAHTIRHTTAVHLLRAGVDINTIRAWLGHVSVDTTNIYAEVDLEMKAKALAHCQVPMASLGGEQHWATRPDLMAFLKSL